MAHGVGDASVDKDVLQWLAAGNGPFVTLWNLLATSLLYSYTLVVLIGVLGLRLSWL